jgi:hypothetical protein
MKKALFIIYIFSIICINAQNQSDTTNTVVKKTFRNVIKFGPIHMLTSRLNLGYEIFSKNHKRSLNLSGSFLLVSNSNSSSIFYSGNTSNIETYGIAGEAQYRFYLAPVSYSDKNFSYNHIFVAPYFNLAFYETKGIYNIYNQVFNRNEEIPYRSTLSASGGGIVIGYQLFLIKNILSLETYFGGGIRYSYSDTNQSGVYSEYTEKSSFVGNPGYTGIVPRIGFQIGITL